MTSLRLQVTKIRAVPNSDESKKTKDAAHQLGDVETQVLFHSGSLMDSGNQAVQIEPEIRKTHTLENLVKIRSEGGPPD
ncbi:MAG TPA: hypothetical protein VL475_14775 [Planctomycetaceae bacterium]|nr:hypothetical protein [Planctomycetaceae bacterium]